MPTTIIQPAQYDTFLGSDAGANTYYGAAVDFWVGNLPGFGSYRPLLKFDLSAIPVGSKITEAILSLYWYAQGPVNLRTVRAWRCLRPWPGTAVTWNKYDGVNAWTTAGCGGAGTDFENVELAAFTMVGTFPQWVNWSINAAGWAVLENWVNSAYANYGFFMRSDTENTDDKRFYSSEYAVDLTLRPKLTITWTPPWGRLAAYIVDGLQGGVTLKATVEQFANEIWARHTPVGGALTRTPAGHSIDAASQAKFGRKDQPLSGGAASVTIADQISDTYLSFQSTPNMPDITLAPGTIIKDQNGNVVPPEEIRPNNWMLIENLALPTSAVFSSLIQNPMALFIEEVSYDETSGLGITAGKDRFTQSLVARIAGRGGG